jgi:hypothetical protein
MILTDKIWLGAAAGAAGMGAFGDKDKPVEDRLASGALVGAMAGLGARSVYEMSKPAGRIGRHGSSMYLSSMSSRYEGLTKANMKPFAAAFHAYGTRGAFTGLGAVIGAVVAGEDNRMQGAAIGGAAGFAARTLVGGANVYKQWGTMKYPSWAPTKFMGKVRNTGQVVSRPGGRLAFIAGLSTLAFAAGGAFSNHDEVTAASYNAGTGYDEYAPGAAPDSGIQERVKNMGATGNVVLGAHGSRHG